MQWSNASVFTTLFYSLELNWSLSLFPTLNQLTQSCPCTKHGFHRLQPNIFIDCPWDLWIITVKQSLTRIWILFSVNGHSDGIISILWTNTFCPVTRPVMTSFCHIIEFRHAQYSCISKVTHFSPLYRPSLDLYTRTHETYYKIICINLEKEISSFTQMYKTGKKCIFYMITLSTSALTNSLRHVKLLPGYGGSSSNHTVFTVCLLINFYLKCNIWTYLVNQINHVLTKLKPTVTSLPNTQSAVLRYHTLHHLTHVTLTRLASHLTACLRYLLLTIFSFTSLCTQPLLLPTVLECTLGI
jgi:hypothetical protein